ncbi:MAG TPA: HEAT repeat domain-containing protein [Bacillota bacterium]|nr:HEAT repeat domain-containing protein [Bacillota bacterium]
MPDIGKELINLDDSKKIGLIKSISQRPDEYPNSIQIMEILSKDNDDEIRWTVAEALMEFDDIHAEQILNSLVIDENETVRVCACESLRYGRTKETIRLLKERLIIDKSSLVRGYAALSLADIVREDPSLPDFELVPFLKERINKEKNAGVKISIYKSLYNLGEREYLDLLLHEINNREYRNRCAVVNLVSDSISEENKKKVLPFLKQRLKIEKTVAVKSIIEEVLNEFEE